jgi:predicted transcriptional regulator
MKEQDLLDIKKEIEKAKQEKDQIKGQQEYLKKTMKEKFDVKDMKSIDTKLKEWKKEIDDFNEEFEKGCEKLKKNLKKLENKYL